VPFVCEKIRCPKTPPTPPSAMRPFKEMVPELLTITERARPI
jgi:hypothetical protein